jgi:hypothetical protein
MFAGENRRKLTCGWQLEGGCEGEASCMAWVVDTCLLLDIGLDDPAFAESSENLVLQISFSRVVISPVTFAELA